MIHALVGLWTPAVRGGPRVPWVCGLLAVLVGGVALWSMGTGAADVPIHRLWAALFTPDALTPRERLIFIDLRLPRIVLGFLIGGGLAVAGALMQGLFRNPLADPGLVGVGAGAALGAVVTIVLGAHLPAPVLALAGAHLTPIGAFVMGWAAVLLLHRVATHRGLTSVATLLLAGLALQALAGAVTGAVVYAANDQQLRDLTFWTMGSLAGATWAKVAAALPLLGGVLLAAPLLARGLNALSLGEAQAQHLGLQVERVKSWAILATAAAAGIAVALAGGIGFVGVVVPHVLRLICGPDHRLILPGSALLGGGFLVGADMVARCVVAPAELPIGIVTALIGAPVFLAILLRQRPI